MYNSPLDSITNNIRNSNYENIEYIIFDNSENPKYFENLKIWKENFDKEIQKKIKIIRAKFNGGYSLGNNIACKYSTGTLLLIINPDVELDSNFFKIAKKCYIYDDWGIITPKLYQFNKDKKIFSGLNQFYPFQIFSIVKWYGKNQLDDDTYNHIFENFYAHGGCFLIRSDLFKKLNGFDPNFFMYVEETDLCERLRKIGYKTIFFPNLIAIQKNDATLSDFAQQQIIKNNLIFIAKNHSLFLFCIQIIFSFFRVVLYIQNPHKKIQIKFNQIIPLINKIFEGTIAGLQYIMKNKN